MKPPSICIIDDSPLTTQLYRYLFAQLLIDPSIYTFGHPGQVDIDNFTSCDLVVIDEIMEGMTGTQFINHVITHYFDKRYHEFPNVIFVSSLAQGDMHERIKSYNLDHIIPSYRVLEKPLTPALIKQTILSICPSMGCHMHARVMVPDSNLSWTQSICNSLRVIFSSNKKSNYTPHLVAL